MFAVPMFAVPMFAVPMFAMFAVMFASHVCVRTKVSVRRSEPDWHTLGQVKSEFRCVSAFK